MKKRLLTSLLATFCLSTAAFAQQQDKYVVFELEHLLAGSPLISGNIGQNDLGNDFKLHRMQYYVDQVILVHDGGQVDTANFIGLVNGLDQLSSYNLGSFQIDSLEAIRFAVGVNIDLNHEDPTQYPAQHPLAPKNPSMHWGWTSGYRFIAAEGTAGTNFSQIFEFHGLGNANYAHLTLPTAGTAVGSDTLVVRAVAEYNELFRGINLTSGPVSHGETGGAKAVLHNINNYVFTSVEGNAAMQVEEESIDALVYPNPSNGRFQVKLDQAAQVSVIDMTGRLIAQNQWSVGSHTLVINQPGLYIMRVVSDAGEKSIRLYVH